MNKKTIKRDISLEGIGIHSGRPVRLRLKPAPLDSGISFVRTDLGGKSFMLGPDAISHTNRATILREGDMEIRTPEHLLSACYGLGIDNLIIECDNAEIPIMDGSAKPFADALLNAGIEENDEVKRFMRLNAPVYITEGDKYMIAFPHPFPKFSYLLDYPGHFIGSQMATFEFDPMVYTEQIAPARTYGFEHEVKALLDKGLALGGSLDNAVIIGETGYLNPLRFPDELARHKVLDMMGDLAVLDALVMAHVVGVKSGHELNMRLVKALAALA